MPTRFKPSGGRTVYFLAVAMYGASTSTSYGMEQTCTEHQCVEPNPTMNMTKAAEQFAEEAEDGPLLLQLPSEAFASLSRENIVDNKSYQGPSPDLSVQADADVGHVPHIHMGVLLSQQLEYELRVRQPTETAPVVDKVLIAFVSQVFVCCGFCGVDRCLMGQPLVGVLKGLTCGGLYIWFILDLVVIAYNCLTSAPDIDVIGFWATWAPASIGTAFWISLLGICCNCCCCVGVWKVDTAKYKMKKSIRGLHQLNHLSEVLFGQKIAEPTDVEIRYYFEQIDTDKNGKISKEELAQIFKMMGEELSDAEWEKACGNADTNSDGELDFEEFLAWYKS